MCGIAGWYSWGEQRLTQEQVTKLWIENEFRGRDAAGVAYLKPDGRLYYVKDKGRATTLAEGIEPKTWGSITRSPYGLLHTRAKTQGSENENANNHPTLGYGWALVHNGMIMNDDQLFDHHKAPRVAEVDTIAINLALSQGKTLEDSLAHACTVRGSASVAAVCLARPQELVLFRLSGADVHLYWMPSHKLLVWSSDRDGYKALTDIHRGGFGDLATQYLLPDNTAFHLTPSGVARYALTPRPFGPSTYGYTAGRGGRSTFFRGTATSTAATTTGSTNTGKKKRKRMSAGGSVSLLSDNGLLELPHFQGSFVDYHIRTRFENMMTDSEKQLVVPTGYGRWVLAKEGPDVTYMFLPHRRVAARWKVEFGEEYRIELPADETQADDLSYLLRVAPVEIQPDQNGRVNQAFMCPWCGVLRHPLVWQHMDFTCDWCNVLSNPPKREDLFDAADYQDDKPGTADISVKGGTNDAKVTA